VERIGRRLVESFGRRLTVSQVRELLDALNLIADESNRVNASLEMLFREKAESLQSTFKRKMG
jgi:hypothetical protein